VTFSKHWDSFSPGLFSLVPHTSTKIPFHCPSKTTNSYCVHRELSTTAMDSSLIGESRGARPSCTTEAPFPHMEERCWGLRCRLQGRGYQDLWGPPSACQHLPTTASAWTTGRLPVSLSLLGDTLHGDCWSLYFAVLCSFSEIKCSHCISLLNSLPKKRYTQWSQSHTLPDPGSV
jgi:hypothetical protein